MTVPFTVSLVLAALGTGVLVGRWYERRGWVEIVQARKNVEAGRIRNLIEYRVAIHEAGHAVCAWFDPFTVSIDRITIDDGAVGEGKVLHTGSGRGADASWNRIATLLGGIAAEMVEFQRMRSGTARTDLEQAIKLAREIVSAGATQPPWEREAQLPDDHFDTSKMYRSVPSDSAEARVLNLAYVRAKHLVETHREQVLVVAHELTKGGVIDAAGVRRIFGRRFLWPLR